MKTTVYKSCDCIHFQLHSLFISSGTRYQIGNYTTTLCRRRANAFPPARISSRSSIISLFIHLAKQKPATLCQLVHYKRYKRIDVKRFERAVRNADAHDVCLHDTSTTTTTHCRAGARRLLHSVPRGS